MVAVKYDNQGLVPVIIQDTQTLEVLMLGYMNEEALAKTQNDQIVTFYSRSKQRLWTKGETSGNLLKVQSMHYDCDQDALLIKAFPLGPTCHTGSRSCFETELQQNFVFELENVIAQRIASSNEDSYVKKLTQKGLNKVAQKVGEEAVETVIAALAESESDFINEASDLFFHYLVLLQQKGYNLATIAQCLQQRHLSKK